MITVSTHFFLSQRAARQAGLSLVESMIALTLGSILMAGIGQVYLANRNAQNLIESQVELQDDARYLTEVFRSMVGSAGYRIDPSRSVGSAFGSLTAVEAITVPDGGSFVVPGTPNKQVRNAEPATTALILRFQGDADHEMQTCSSTEIDPGEWATVVLYQNQDDEAYCWSWRTDPDEIKRVQNQLVANGVIEYRLAFGIDDNGDAVANRFVEGADGFDASQIVAVRPEIMLQGDYILPETGEARTLSLRETFSVRNRVP